ncbi:glycosyltransferase family 2 protein [Ottowia thiooxydans]|uniref:glycosyltransferase family 2 protein n=1 Tax=Ottowia thiooxydans TaxID=219182 RepID=UPI00041D9FE6|nr:glycosyltransferase family A protein [Ottowia thiooxydans]
MITVVIASYRYGHLASHCIESLLGQSQLPERILFVDDGAGDCAFLETLYPEVDFVLRDKNLGVVANFQDMLERVKSEYVMYLGADNWLRSDAIEILSTARSDIATYNIVVTGELKEQISRGYPDSTQALHGDYYWRRAGQHHGSMLYRTEVGRKVGYARRPGAHANHPEEDWNLWNGMIAAGATVTHVDQALLYYRRHRENFLKSY